MKSERVTMSGREAFDAEELRSRLEAVGSIRQVCFREEVDSTNTWAGCLAREGAPDGTLAVADAQTQGKGRRGRSWSSPAGSSIYMSLLLRPGIPPQNAAPLTLVMGLAAATVLKQEFGLPAQIKWPNDVVVSGKKICGILTEMNARLDKVEHVIIGVGINANIRELPEDICDVATSVELELGKRVSRADLCVAVVCRFEQYYREFLKSGDLTGLRRDYESYMVNYGKEIKVLGPGEVFGGTAGGINEKGELLVERDDGTVTTVMGGEVSVRGIYGYV